MVSHQNRNGEESLAVVIDERALRPSGYFVSHAISVSAVNAEEAGFCPVIN